MSRAVNRAMMNRAVGDSGRDEAQNAARDSAGGAHFRPPFDRLSDEDLLAHCRDATAARFFPLQDHAQTMPDKMAGIMAGRFDLINETHHLPAPINWLRNPSQDLEWLILLHKFYYAVGLGAEYARDGDPHIVCKWMELTESWMDAVEPDLLAGASPLNSDLFVAVTGRRLQNWIFAYHHFVSTSELDLIPADFHRRFLISIQSQTNHLLTELAPARNHRTIELSAVFLAAVAFPELRHAAGWLDFASNALWDNIRADLLPDGVQCELSTDYHHLVLRNYLSVRRLARMNGVAVPEDVDQRLRAALEFSLHVHKPDGEIPSLSDGDIADYRDLLRQGWELYQDATLLHGATEGREGTAPARRAAGFPDSGYYIARSGWGDGAEPYAHERWMVFDCGPLGEGNHGHLDALNLELAAFGRSLVVDPGRYTYSETGEINWRVKFRGTASHNTVLVDGRDQTRYAPRPKKPGRPDKYKIQGPAPDCALRAFVNAEGCDYLHGVARSHEYDALHERRVFFLGGEYWIVWDVLLAEQEHRYDQLFHLSAQAEGAVQVETGEATLRLCSPNLLLARAADERVAHGVDPGFVSRAYGEKQPAPVARFTRRARDAAMHAVLFPWREAAPNVTVREWAVSEADGAPSPVGAQAISVTVTKPDGGRFTDFCLIAPPDGRARRVADIRFDGAWAAIRFDSAGAPLSLCKDPGATLSLGPAGGRAP